MLTPSRNLYRFVLKINLIQLQVRMIYNTIKIFRKNFRDLFHQKTIILKKEKILKIFIYDTTTDSSANYSRNSK